MKETQTTSPPGASGLVETPTQRWWEVAGICALLVIMVLIVFGQTLQHQFVNYDDDQYVYSNPIVCNGLSLEGVGWAFTHVLNYNWHPLTTLSHMADCQFYGLWAGGHHLTSLLLHAAAAVLLFLLLLEMTGALWRSAFVAAVFAIHPLRVESVAWVAERKDVLSGVFFMLTLWAYARYARAAEVESVTQEIRNQARLGDGELKTRGFFLLSCFPDSKTAGLRYLTVLTFFALGLLSKAMLVTIPFVLLLLDYWPLGRLQNRSQLPRLLCEKLPLFAITAVSFIATMIAFKGAVEPSWSVPFSLRVGSALVTYVIYLGKLIYPTGLASLYPFLKNGWPAWQVIGAVLLLAALTAGVFGLRRKQPYLVVGWLWYLGMLMPVSGVIQAGNHAYADRYTYLPQIGLCVAGTWVVADWAGQWWYRRMALGGGAIVTLCVLMVAAYHQTRYWRDSITLWTHTIGCTQDNSIANLNLGVAMREQGRVEAAIAQYREALRIDPAHATARCNLGSELLQQGRTEEAIAQFQAALKINPAYAEAHNNLGNGLLQQGRTEEAIAQFQEALRIKPALAEAHNNLGNGLLQQGRTDEAIVQYRDAVRVNPAYAEAHNNLGTGLLRQGHTEEAIAQYREALRINPALADAHKNLGNTLFEQGRMEEAIAQYCEALRIKPADVEVHFKLGTALLGLGRWDEAIAHTQKALDLQPDNSAIQNNLAWMLASVQQLPLRNGARAVQLATQASQSSGGSSPVMLRTLAAAYAEAGDFSNAVQTAQHALELAEAKSNTDLASKLRREIKLYEAGESFREGQ